MVIRFNEDNKKRGLHSSTLSPGIAKHHCIHIRVKAHAKRREH